MPAGQLLATFTLSRDDIERVKDAVAAEAARGPVHLAGRQPRLCLVVQPPSQRGDADEHHHTRGEHGRRRPPDLLRPPFVDEPPRSPISTSATASAQRSPWHPRTRSPRPAAIDEAVVESRVSRRGEGGMEVGVPLQRDDMARFRTCFADAIVGLHAQRKWSGTMTIGDPRHGAVMTEIAAQHGLRRRGQRSSASTPCGARRRSSYWATATPSTSAGFSTDAIAKTNS
nr:unnamed protein product [Digitaria exilis]